MKTDKEQRIKNRKSGYILPAIMLAAMIGVLFGLGRLAMFRYQCQIRLDRQRELDRTLAVRSALRWLEVSDPPPEGTNVLTYVDRSGRQIEVAVRRMPSIYPAPGENEHLRIGLGPAGNQDVVAGGFVQMLSPAASMQPDFVDDDDYTHVLQIGSDGGDVGQTGRVVIDMPGVGSWLDSLYGRRYWIGPTAHVNQNQEPTGEGDAIRMIITPAGEDFEDPRTPAIWMTQAPIGPEDLVPVTLRARSGYGGATQYTASVNFVLGKGIQLVGNMATLFSWKTTGTDFGEYDLDFEGLVLPDALVDAFRQDADSGRDLRVQVEVESRCPTAGKNTLCWIRVDPAYEYAIDLSWTARGGSLCQEQATVVHLFPFARVQGRDVAGKSFTYETHGTEREM